MAVPKPMGHLWRGGQISLKPDNEISFRPVKPQAKGISLTHALLMVQFDVLLREFPHHPPDFFDSVIYGMTFHKNQLRAVAHSRKSFHKRRDISGLITAGQDYRNTHFSGRGRRPV